MNKTVSAKMSISLAAIALVAGCQKQEEKPSGGNASGIVSAEKTSFDEVTAKLDKGGNFYLYLSTEQALGGLSDKISGLRDFANGLPGMTGEQGETMGKIFDFVTGWIKDSGVEEIDGVGMSSIAREPGFYCNRFIVHHYPGKNQGVIWSLAGTAPHSLDELNLLPADTVLATFSDFDMPLLWSNVQAHLEQLNIPTVTAALQAWPQQFHDKTGLDFDKTLDSFGGNYGVIVTFDNEKKVSLPLPSGALEIPNPSLAIIAKVKSDVIFDRIDAVAKGNPLVVSVNDPDLKMRTVTIPIPLPVELRPSVARSGDYLMLTTSDAMVHEILDVKAGKKKGFKDTPEFAHLSQGIPKEGNNFTIIADQFMQTIMQFQQQSLTNKGMSAAQVQNMQHVFNSSTNYGAYQVGANGTEGWEGCANGSQGYQSMIIPAAMAVVGVGAAIAIPGFVKARAAAQATSMNQSGNGNSQTAKYNHIIKNLRLIQAAKLKWAAEKGKETGEAVTMDDLAPYFTDGPIEPVADEEYNPQPIGSAPTARLAHALHGHAAGSEITAPAIRKKKQPAS